MTFQDFEKRVIKVAKMDLPGEAFHMKMAPIERLLELKRRAREMQSAKKAGVMALFYPDRYRETHFVLILRKSYNGVHSAQVGFPGGKLEEEDLSLEQTALRETHEEIGVPAENVSVLKKLTEIYIPPSNYFVQPYFGLIQETPTFIRQEDEVEALIEVPVREFLSETSLITQTLSTSYATRIKVPAYQLQGHVVWGATAMMLSEVREMLRVVLTEG